MMLMFPPDPVTGISSLSELAFSAAVHAKVWRTDPSAHYHVARSPSGDVIGVAKWNFFTSEKSQYPWPKESPPGTNVELCEFYFGGLDKARNEWMREKRHALMAILAVVPEWQRKGVGKKLLEWGLRKADEEGTEIWIDSSPQGKGLYESVRWKEVGGLEVELGRWGGKEGKVRRTVHMVREPVTR